MSTSIPVVDQLIDLDAVDTTEARLYIIGGAAALLCAFMYVVALEIFVTANRAGPPPSTVLEWFSLFQHSAITGLFLLGLADIVIMILWVPMVLALYTALKQTDKAAVMIATTLIGIGIAVYLATNIAFSMLSLSHRYEAVAAEAERASILAAGQTMLAVSEGTGGQYAGMPLAWLGGIMISAGMLRSKAFSKRTAWAGIVGLGLLLVSVPFAGYTTVGPTTTIVSIIIAVSYIGGGVLSLAWYVLIGQQLLRQGRLVDRGKM